MSETRTTATYKKKEGTLLVVTDAANLNWTPSAQGPAPLSIPVGRITNIQQTPATAAKVMIKLFVLPDGASPSADATPDIFVFGFNGPNARSECDAVKVALTAAIQAAKTAAEGTGTAAGTPAAAGTPTANATGAGAGSTMAIASALSSAKTVLGGDDLSKARLEADLTLQEALLKSNSDLQRTFHETVIKGAGAIKPSQFWSTRIHLLRAFAIERRQKRGPYNVLATIKPKTVDNVIKLNLSREQIAEIFAQHPLVRRVYDENVPKISEDGFWKKFFQSRLCKKLRGERIMPSDPWDEVLDKYLDQDDDASARKKAAQLPIPTQLSLAKNNQNVSFPAGNRPDITMRPSNPPIIKTLNSLSFKFIDTVTPADSDPSQTTTLLSDLAPPPVEDAIPLPVLKPMVAGEGEKKKSSLPSKEILGTLNSELTQINLSSYSTKFSPVALTQITTTLKAQSPSAPPPQEPLSAAQLVHTTTLEFLRHFYDAFLSGDVKRSLEAEKLAGSLTRAKERIEDVMRREEERKRVEREQREREGLGNKRRRVEVVETDVGLEDLMVVVERAVGWYEEALGKGK